MKDKKMRIAVGLSLLVILLSTYDWAFFVGFPDALSILLSIIPLGLVVGAFAFDKAGKRRCAIVCALLCVIDAIWWQFIWGNAVFGERMAIIDMLKAIGYTIPDVLLLMFVISKKRSQNVWMILGVLLTISTFCCDCAPIGLWLRYEMGFSSSKYGVTMLIIGFVCGIPFGLTYLFGFANASQVQKKKTYSYLEQYKREHGME